MICESRREPHTPSDCVDTNAQRPPQWRNCCWQHRPRAAQVSVMSAAMEPGHEDRENPSWVH